MIVDTIKSDLYELIQKHDWSYMMSDSHNVWESGMMEDKEIQAKIHALCAIHKEDADELYIFTKYIAGPDYTDSDKNGNGLKYRVIEQWFKPYIDKVS